MTAFVRTCLKHGRAAFCALLLAVVSACGGGGGSGGGSATGGGGCGGSCTTPVSALTVAEVQQIISQAVAEAQARGAKGTIAVVDRVGNVLAVFRMTGAATTFTISSGKGVSGGLENVNVLASELAAISKALTAAYLSSEGNAFSTRTASQIIQENFNPGELGQPSGPLFGVQFSQLTCSDLMQRQSAGTVGPKRSPLGLAADPGGLPLYKAGALVGAVGVIADGLYSLDLNIIDIDSDVDELIAVAGTSGFVAPTDRRADRISAGGLTLRFTDSEALVSNPAVAPALATLPGTLIAVAGYAPASITAGVVFGTPGSGIRAEGGAFADLNGYVLVDGGNSNRYPVTADPSPGGMTPGEVTQILRSALTVANRARAQIRRPLGSAAQVTISVVGSNGDVLGLVRTPDAPVFGADVSLQKARTALLFSQTSAAADLSALPDAVYISPAVNSPIGVYVAGMQAFFADPSTLANGVAYSARAVGNIARPVFPDGINGSLVAGPLSKPPVNWSPFNAGLQLDLVYNKLVAATAADLSVGCTGLPQAKNGIQIFPGAVPIYRGAQLIGAIGVSGDGTDQDDMVAFLGLARAGVAVGNASAAMRADTLVPPASPGDHLRYVQCPVAPFNPPFDSESNVCAGF